MKYIDVLSNLATTNVFLFVKRSPNLKNKNQKNQNKNKNKNKKNKNQNNKNKKNKNKNQKNKNQKNKNKNKKNKNKNKNKNTKRKLRQFPLSVGVLREVKFGETFLFATQLFQSQHYHSQTLP